MNTFLIRQRKGEEFSQAVREILVASGWREVLSTSHSATFVFSPKVGYKGLRDLVGRVRVIDKLEGSAKALLSHKARLYEHFRGEPFMPRTVIVSSQDAASAEFRMRADEVVIVKPNDGYEGQDILITQDPADISKFIREHPRYDTWAIQQYLRHPALYRGFKFHVRVVLLAVMRERAREPEFWVADQNRMVLATAPYQDGDWHNEDIHDTHMRRNPSLSPLFPADIPDGWTVTQAKMGHARIVRLARTLVEKTPGNWTRDFGARTGYELFGLDVMFVGKERQLKLLEFNRLMTHHSTQAFLAPHLLHIVLGLPLRGQPTFSRLS